MSAHIDNPTVYHGRLEPFSDQSTEGTWWCLHDPAKPGYGGLHTIESGDLLTVFSDAGRTGILWEGVVEFDHTSHRAPLPLAPSILVQRIGEETVHGIPADIAPDKWLAMFRQHKPCTLVRPYKTEPL